MKRALKWIALVCALAMSVLCCAGCGNAKEEDQTGKKKFTICSDNSFAPFESWDETAGAYVGIDMDILAAIAADQGFEYDMWNVGFDAAMGNVQAGQANGMIAGMTIKPERKETFDFSDPYFNDGQIMSVAANSAITKLEDLKGTTVAAKTGTMGAEYAEANKGTYGYTIQYYEDSPTMYQAIINGTNSACFEDYTVMGTAIKGGVAMKTVGEVINPAPYGFAVKKGTNAELLSLFNAGLKNIKDNGTYAKILEKYGITVE